MGRKKKEDVQMDIDDFTDGVVPQAPPEPVPVKIVPTRMVNPDVGTIPFEGDPLPTKRYKFVYNQQPGTDMEFTRGITVLNKGTQKRKNHYLKYKLMDGEEVELPVQVAEFMMGLTYFDEGRSRPRCTLIPVS